MSKLHPFWWFKKPETLPVESFNNRACVSTSKVGLEPWLNIADGNSNYLDFIATAAYCGDFLFKDSALTTMPSNIFIDAQVRNNLGIGARLQFKLSHNNFASFITVWVDATIGAGWVILSIDTDKNGLSIISYFDSLAKINNAKLFIDMFDGNSEHVDCSYAALRLII